MNIYLIYIFRYYDFSPEKIIHIWKALHIFHIYYFGSKEVAREKYANKYCIFKAWQY